MATTDAVIEALYNIPENGKAEIIDGEVIRLSPTGAGPGRAAGRIASDLSHHEDGHGGGYAFGGNVGFLVNLPGRKSFSPDAAWYTGPLPSEDLDFLPGAPAFAVEVRSKNDYGPKAERAIAQKIADYFAAGTQVVWDVDLLGIDIIRSYRASVQNTPLVFRRDDTADAEPAIPGWTMPVNTLFR
jgi:Uma2 family endonuclease